MKKTRNLKPAVKPHHIARFFLVAAIVSTHLVRADENDPEKSVQRADCPTPPLTLKTPILQLNPRGTILAFSAVEFKQNWEAPVSQLRGNLTRLGLVRFDFYISRYVAIKISGVAQEFLRIRGNPDLSQYDIQSNTASDIGDFSIATVACVVPPNNHHPALGFRIETKLPNTQQDRGLGPNTTDLTLSILATHRIGPASIFADLGLGILTAPRNLDDQNDVLVYGFGFLWKINPKIQFAGEVNGFHSTRRTTPIGTESRSNARFGLVWASPKLAMEIFPSHGLTEREGKWGILVGLSWKLNILVQKTTPK